MKIMLSLSIMASLGAMDNERVKWPHDAYAAPSYTENPIVRPDTPRPPYIISQETEYVKMSLIKRVAIVTVGTLVPAVVGAIVSNVYVNKR